MSKRILVTLGVSALVRLLPGCNGQSASQPSNDAGTDETVAPRDAGDDTSPAEPADASSDADADGGESVPRCASTDGSSASGASLRRTIPFQLTSTATDAGAQGGAGGLGGAGGEGGGGPSGCAPTDPATGGGTLCLGKARATLEGGLPTFTFGDGSALTWTGTGPGLVAPPAVSSGQSVWIDYAMQTYVICPFCGSYSTTLLSISSEEGGDILWVGREGTYLDEVEPALTDALFGVPTRLELACRTEQYSAACYDVVRDVFDRVLETEPEQRIPHATVQRVVTPGGEFDLFWASSSETSAYQDGCYDGNPPTHDRGFAASRIPPSPGR